MSCVPHVHCEENKYGNQMVGCMTFTFVMNDTYETLERQDKQDFCTNLIGGFRLWKPILLMSLEQKKKTKTFDTRGVRTRASEETRTLT